MPHTNFWVVGIGRGTFSPSRAIEFHTVDQYVVRPPVLTMAFLFPFWWGISYLWRLFSPAVISCKAPFDQPSFGRWACRVLGFLGIPCLANAALCRAWRVSGRRKPPAWLGARGREVYPREVGKLPLPVLGMSQKRIPLKGNPLRMVCGGNSNSFPGHGTNVRPADGSQEGLPLTTVSFCVRCLFRGYQKNKSPLCMRLQRVRRESTSNSCKSALPRIKASHGLNTCNFALELLVWRQKHGCGSNMRTQNGTLVNGTKD